MDAYIFSQFETDYTSIGMAGALVLTKCEHEERAGGLSELAFTAALDWAGRWKYIENGVVIKVPVPVRTTPPITGTSLVTQVVKGRVLATATRNQRAVWSKSKDGKKKTTAKVGLECTVVKNPSDRDRYNIKWKKGNGWIDKDAIELIEPETIPATPEGIESVESAWSVREQLFRVYEYERTDKGVNGKARHITFDLLGNLTTFMDKENLTCQTALDGILQNCAEEHEFEAYTDITTARVGLDARGLNPIKAFSDPENGVIKRWGAEHVRDDFELYFLTRAGLNRGTRIEYGKNLKGVEMKVDWSKLVTNILPVGEDADGNPIYLTDDPKKASKEITAASYVTSPRNSAYATPHIQQLVVSDAKITPKDSKDAKNEVTMAIACERMRAAAEEQFENGADLPEINLTVDYLRLGDTEEYKQYAQLDDVFLYDTVRVVHKPLGIDMDINVVRVVYDCVKGKYSKIELGSLRDQITTSLATWQIPTLNGSAKISLGSLGSGQFANEVISARLIQANTIMAYHIMSDIIETRHLSAESITAEKINANALFSQNLVAAIATIVNANIGKADIGDVHIDYANIVDLNALFATIANAQIGKAQIGYAQVTDLDTGKLVFQKGVGGKLYIADLAVTDANMVNLTVGELVVKGTDGRFYTITTDAEGNVVGVLKQVNNADVVDNSIDGGVKLLENSITARTLNVNEIFANEIMAQVVTAYHIKNGTITTAQVSSDFGAGLDLSSNTYIRSMVSADTAREMIANSTRELRVTYDGAGTHMTKDTDTTTMTASVWESGVDISGTVPDGAYIWTRASEDQDGDAAWAAERVGTKIISVSQADVNNRSIISCTLLGLGDVALEFYANPDTLRIEVINPPLGADRAYYDLSDGKLHIEGEGYLYDPQTQTIRVDKGLSPTSTTVQFTFSDEVFVRSQIIQTNDTIALIIDPTTSTPTSITLTPGMIEAVSDTIVLDGKVVFTDFAPGVQQFLQQVQALATEAEADAAAAQGAASNAQGTANAASGTANSTTSKLVALCKDSNMTYIHGSMIWTGTISADKIITDNLYAYRLKDPAVSTNSWLQLETAQDMDGSASAFGYGLVRNGAREGGMSVWNNSTSNDVHVGTDQPGRIGDGTSIRIRKSSGTFPVGTSAAAHRAIFFYVAPYGVASGGESAADPAVQIYRSVNTWDQVLYVTGNIRYTGTSQQVSDIRLKKDIKPLDVDILDRLAPKEYRMIDNDRKVRWGLVAQDVQRALEDMGRPDAALLVDDEDSLALAYTELIAPLVAGYQALKREKQDLESRLARLESLLGVTNDA